MKKVLLILFLVISSNVFASNFVSTPPQLHQVVQKLLSYPRAQQVLDEAQRGGGIRLKYQPVSFSSSNALWCPDERSIILNSTRARSEDECVRSILFELHNAKNNYKFANLDRLVRKGQINKPNYIREVERVEHSNALQTSQIINEAISKGYYAQGSYWPIHPDFETHYRIQQQGGHSQFIGKMYDQLRHKGLFG